MLPITPLGFFLVFLAAIAAGFINALAGGGTLITFPMLTWVGLPAISANVTNTVALLPGYLGATFAQSKDLQGQRKRLFLLIPAAMLGGLIGGLLLLGTGEKLFRQLVPYLILLASVLLALQDPMRKWLGKRLSRHSTRSMVESWAVLPVGLAAIYGGYFGAGLSVIVLAVLGLVIEENLTRLNALKQMIGFCTNVAAAVFFLFSGKVIWSAALIMMVGALIGGAIGGKLAGKIKPSSLRWIVVSVGVIVALVYFIRG